MSKAVMCVFESNHLGYQILEQRISREVESAGDAGTLFRSNSLSARMFSFYVRMMAMPYLWWTLVTSVNSLNDNAIETFGAESGTTPQPFSHACSCTPNGKLIWSALCRRGRPSVQQEVAVQARQGGAVGPQRRQHGSTEHYVDGDRPAQDR
jgi:hypothetical protein